MYRVRSNRRHHESSGPVDDADIQILELLTTDGRISVADLASRVNVSRANAYSRLQRLRQQGILKGFTAEVDPTRLGLSIFVVVLINLQTTREIDAVAERLRDMPEIEFAAITTGDFDLLVLARVPDVGSLRTLIVERLQPIPGLRATITSLILDEILRRPAVVPRSVPSR